MKNVFFSILFLAMSAGLIIAQEVSPSLPNGYIGISLGPTFAIGDYRSHSISNKNAGYAKSGFHFNLVNVGYVFDKNFGICGLWGASLNGVDVDQMVKDAIATSNDESIKWSIQSTNWSIGYFMVGGFVTYPVNKVNIEVKLLLGSMKATSPEVTIKEINGTTTTTTVLENTIAYALAVGFGGGLRIHLSPKVDLLTSIDYIEGNPRFRSPRKSKTLRSVDLLDRNIAMINLSGGLAYRF